MYDRTRARVCGVIEVEKRPAGEDAPTVQILLIATFFTRTNSARPSRPPSRPKPLRPWPPNGAFSRAVGAPLTWTVPALSRWASFSARVRFVVCR